MGSTEEVSLDNWELSTVFYDSTVDNGNTPLTEINWDASDGGYENGETRVITVQINYKNTNAVTTYQPGELEISIPNLIYFHSETIDGNSMRVYTGGYLAHWDASVVVGANDSTHVGYDWNLKNALKPSSSVEKFSFVNSNLIEENTNFEGSIKIVYTITPMYEQYVSGNHMEYEDECTHTLLMDIVATLNGTLKSNKITMDYKRIYTHPWKYLEYNIEKKATKVSSLDGLPSGDYYWVKYVFYLKTNVRFGFQDYPYMRAKYYISDNLPTDIVVLDSNQNILDLNGKSYIKDSFSIINAYSLEEYIYVGYPKSIYNEKNNNLEVTNSVDLYLKYYNEESFLYSGSSEVSIDLSEYDFNYDGDLYSVSKGVYAEPSYGPSYNYYQSLTGEKIDIGTEGIQEWYLFSKTIYDGKKYDLKIGDDLLYITRDNKKIEQLSDEEYYFSKIYFPMILYNGNNRGIQKDKYSCELWVRYQNTSEYILYEKFANDFNNYKIWKFTKDDKINGFYILIKDIEESIIMSDQMSCVRAYTTINNAKNISESGTIYNFDYIEVYIDDILQNNVDVSNYDSTLIQLDIASNDMETYGKYHQRGFNSYQYSYCVNVKLSHFMDGIKEMKSVTQDAEKEEFLGTAELIFGTEQNSAYGHGYGNLNTFDYSDYIHLSYSNKFNYEEGMTGFEIYDLLPEGMELKSTKDDILNSLYVRNFYYIYNIDQQKIKFEDLKKIIFDNTNISIQDNYNDTNRTLLIIKVDLTDYPLYNLEFSYGSYHLYNWFSFSYDYSISYDAYLEYGSVWKNSASFFFVGNEGKYWNSKKDNDDINKNGNTTEKYDFASDSITITSAISTHQDLTTYVQTDKNNYSTGVVDASYGSNYEYKLRVRTGSSDVTNLILYTNIEEGHNGRGHWKGEFLGIDTTYAEGKGYTIKIYYSEKSNATNMKDDSSWQEYTDKTDKAKVKSLAFVFLDSEGNVAVLPKNSLVYILLKMKAPSDENIKTLAYNNSWTEWNAIDSVTKEPVDFITGINSNIVKVSLPNSVQYEDIEINLEKIWKDNNNEFGLRPKEITYKVISNGDIDDAIEVILNTGDVNLTNSNKWSKIIEVPKYDDEGEEIIYTINEVAPTLPNNYTYIKTIDNLSITNELAKSITITKKWMDNKNSYLTRPSNVTIKVLQNGKNYKDIIITGDYSINEWVKTIDVPVYDEKGKEYVYTLEEVSVDNYESSYDSVTYTFTNTLVGEEEIVITKKWIDNHNKFNTRPKEILVKLKQNGRDYQSLTMNGDSDTWLSEKIIVPKYDSKGTKYIYTIEEDPLNSYGFVEYDQTNYVITNTLKENIGIVVTKNWIDDNNSYDTRPGSLNITLLQNNKEYKILTLSGNGNTWTNDIEVPKYDDNQEEYKYTIKELNENIITEYSDVTYGEDGLSVTNKLKKNVDLIITKKWIDYNNEYLTRPDKITINLFQNGVLYEKLELTGKDNTWSNKILNVPAYDENGIKYHYTIEEVNDGETSKYQKITYDQTTLTVTNELTERPKVTLYFTVKNGYATDDDEIKFDEEGLKELLKAHNLNVDGEYLYEFKLENISTGDVYKGYLSTQGILEFSDLPYGTYRAVEGEDEYFDFVSMLNIEDIPGVTFKKDEIGGIIEIVPTGTDIIYGVNVVNKIKVPVDNPPTTSLNIFCLLGIIIAAFISCCYFIKTKKEF